MISTIRLDAKLAKFTEHWSPRIVARMNDCEFKLVKFQGEFVWHHHAHTDEVFLVLRGEMVVHFLDGDVPVRQGDMIVIPKGVEHKTSAATECCAMIVEAAGTVNTGNAGGAMTADPGAWI